MAIARGGLPIGGALGYALGVKNCATINVEFYTGIGERMEVPVVLPPTPPLVDLAGLKILVADDVADSGITLALIRDLVGPHVAELRTAVLYKKPWSVVDPDYFWAADRGLDRLPLVVRTAGGLAGPGPPGMSWASYRRRRSGTAG